MIVGIIPARGGSQRIPNKNIQDLGGKPLIAWTIEAAYESRVFDKFYVSTESREIAEVALQYLKEEWGQIWLRPDRLARAETPMIPVVHNIVEKVGGDVTVLLQPTSPFRTAHDIQQSVALLYETGGDSVVSVTEAEPDLNFEIGFGRRLRSVKNIVVPNGALYLLMTDALLRGEDWYSGLSYAYTMPKDRSIDIDTPLDLEIARFMISQKVA